MSRAFPNGSFVAMFKDRTGRHIGLFDVPYGGRAQDLWKIPAATSELDEVDITAIQTPPDTHAEVGLVISSTEFTAGPINGNKFMYRCLVARQGPCLIIEDIYVLHGSMLAVKKNSAGRHAQYLLAARDLATRGDVRPQDPLLTVKM